MGILRTKTEKTDKSFEKVTDHITKKGFFASRRDKAKNEMEIRTFSSF